MKFAAHLSEGLVPEWRDQYFDYKGGKKRLKKLSASRLNQERKPQSFQASPETLVSSSLRPLTVSQLLSKPAGKGPAKAATPALPKGTAIKLSPSVVSTSTPRLSKPSKSFSRLPPGADVAKFSSGLPYQSQPTSRIVEYSIGSTFTGLKLPPPAIREGDSDDNSRNSSPVDPKLSIPNSTTTADSKPGPSRLKSSLASPDRKKSSLSAIHPPDSPSPFTTTVSFNPNPEHYDAPPINDRSPLLENQFDGTPTNAGYNSTDPVPTLQRPSTTSVMSYFNNKLSPGPLRNRFQNIAASQEVPLELLLESAQQDFVEWVDSEVEKIEKFYCEKEAEAIEKYLILQDQLIQFNQHKSDIKEAIAKGEGINRAALTTKEAIFREFEMPTLPEMFKRNHHKSMSDDTTNDFSRKPDRGVAYSVARAQLKIAVKEFYRSLELLKDYRSLNSTAVRKMVKKFDKTAGCNTLPGYMDKVKKYKFFNSDVLDNLIPRTEDLYAYYFESSNHKRAVEKLRATDFPALHYAAMFTTGLLLGLSLPLLIDGIVAGLRHISDPRYPDTTFLFQIWGGFFLANLFVCLFMLNLYTWTKFKINYPFIFEFDQHNYLDYRQYGEIPALMLLLLSIFGWLTFRDFWPDQFPGRYFPPIYLGLCVFLILCPLPILHWRARKWLIVAVWRLLLSGCYPVEFRDFFLGDIFCSLNYSISNVSMFFCLYATHWQLEGSSIGCSSSHSRLLGFLNCLPSIWRLLQCFRRYGDTGDKFPHLANGLKYSCLIMYYMFLSLARIDHGSTTYRSFFILFACMNSIYSSLWDIFMDFSLAQANSKHWLLRNELAFGSVIPYYTIIIVDPIMRFNWVLYAVFWNQIEQSAKISFFVALIEIVRRFFWVFFRVENEHCANVGRFRASRDLTLPYAEAKKVQARTEEQVEAAVNAQPDEDVEAQMSEVRTDTTPDTTVSSTAAASPLRRKNTFASIATPVINALSLALKSAHTADFERRRADSQPGGDHADDDDDDDDDDSILEGTTGSRGDNFKD